MAYSPGRCTNVDYCSLAASRRHIEVRVGEDFICPECARPLRAPVVKDAPGGRNLLLAGGAVAVVLIAGGIYAGYRLSSPATSVSGPAGSPPPQAATAEPGQPAKLAAIVAPVAVPTPVPAPVPLTSSAPSASPAVRTSPTAPVQAVLLRLRGSAVLGSALVPRLAAGYLASLGNTGVAVEPGHAPGEALVTGQRLSRPEAISITTQDDAAGFTALGSGGADIAMSSRRVDRAELDRLRALGDLSAAGSEHAVALEGQAVIVSPRNPVSQISLVQLRGVLDGSIAAWPALAGTGQAIHVLAEPGTQSLVPGGPDLASGTRRVADAASAVAADPDALALVPMARVGQAKVLAIAVLGARPALPSPASVADETYPLARKLYFYAPADGTNPFARRFIAFALSPEGQAAVTQAGLVPLTAAAVATPVALTPKDRYKQLVTGAARLAADLHFEPSSNKLDLRSSREVDRVWNFMMSDHSPPDHLILIGFADNLGTPEANQALAQQRADTVAGVFARRGLPPGRVVSFGPDLPIADNATQAGRDKNRRVEVFLRQ